MVADRPANSPHVVPMTEAHLPRVTQVMARAFHREPIMQYTLPDEDDRPGQIRWLFGRIARYAMRYGRAHTTEDVRGFAIWLAPGDPDMQVLRLLRLGIAAAPCRLGYRSVRRLMRFSKVKDALHHRLAPERHWYLLMLGVDPEAQGGGVGSALVRPVLEQADADGLPCYLETAVEQNTRIFGKYGFETAGEADLTDTLHLWGMTRQARQAG